MRLLTQLLIALSFLPLLGCTDYYYSDVYPAPGGYYTSQAPLPPPAPNGYYSSQSPPPPSGDYYTSQSSPPHSSDYYTSQSPEPYSSDYYTSQPEPPRLRTNTSGYGSR